ncbi:MAG: hypothetical protein RBR86_01005 [Pseudobdellovibrionaceae bacterium]|jgi:ABC-type uncharacterized transport system permease subunit|nr:hypothetical protein [Pseudobdellovibrionaceae bacterium]
MKYYHFARIAFGDHLNNRLRIFTRYLVFLLLDWVMIAMWSLIYKSGYGPASIYFRDMAWYMAFAQMMFFLSPRLFVVIDSDVRSGNIGYFLNRPIPYLWMRFAEGVGALAGNLLIYYVVSLPFIYLMIGDWPTGGWIAITSVFGGLVLASVLHLLFQIFAGLSTFWTNDAVFIYHSYQKFCLLLGGIYVPLSLYPSFIPESVLKFLPFASLVGNPVGLLFHPTWWGVLEVLALQMFWLGFVGVCLSMFYQMCLRKVEVHGG